MSAPLTPTEAKELLRLCESGKLYEIDAWIRAGRSLTVLERNTPIARIVPWKEGDASFDSRPPLPGAPLLRRVKLPPPLSLRGDIVKLLLKERQNDR